MIDQEEIGEKAAYIAKDRQRVKWHNMVETDVEDKEDKRIGHERDEDDTDVSEAYHVWKLQFDEHVAREETLSAAVDPQASSMMALKLEKECQTCWVPTCSSLGSAILKALGCCKREMDVE